MKRLLIVMALIGLAMPTGLHAHHVVSESGVAWVEPMSTAELTTSASSFDFDDEFVGSWQTMSIRAEWSFWNSFSASANIPWGRVRFDDGRQAIGLMDIELNAKLRLFASEHGGFIASAGIGAGLPTGEFADGLGSGHFEVAPFVIASSQPLGWLIINSLVVSKHGISSQAESVDALHGSIIAPHGDVETDIAISAAAVIGTTYLKTEGRRILSWSDPDQNSTSAALEAGYSRPGQFRFALRGDTWIRGWSRSGPKVSASFAYFF